MPGGGVTTSRFACEVVTVPARLAPASGTKATVVAPQLPERFWP